MSLIQPLKFRTLKTVCLQMPRLQMPHLQMGVFQVVITVACGKNVWGENDALYTIKLVF